MLVTALGLLLVVAVALFIAWPMLGAGADVSETPPETPAAEASGALERRRDAALSALKEAEFDHQVGKLSDEDHAALRADLEARAMEAIAALDQVRAEATAAAPSAAAPAAADGRARRRFCAGCGRRARSDEAFCAGCGRPLAPASSERPRRRA